MKKRILVYLLLLILLSTYNFQNSSDINSKITIKEIIIENNKILEKRLIKDKLSFLYNTNLLMLDAKKIENKLSEIDLIDNFKIKKIYPFKIKFTIFESNPIAIIHNKKEKKFYTSKGSFINYRDLDEFKNLPIVFGEEKSFKIFYEGLKTIDFPINEIKTFYLFETQRWDMVTKKNQIIKLPSKNYDISLKNFLSLKDQGKFNKYKTFDYRIKDQLILK